MVGIGQKSYGFQKFCTLKINLAIGFIRKKPTGMHWLGYNDAVSWLNEAKTRIFQPTANFENFEIYLHFICLPDSQPAVHIATSIYVRGNLKNCEFKKGE